LLFNVVQFRPLVLAARDRFAVFDVAGVLRLCVVLTFRYNIIGQRNANELEKVYNEVSLKIRDGSVSRPAQVAVEFQRVYPTDEEFKNDFSARSIVSLKKSKLLRYILTELEHHLSQGADIDYETSPATLEHILPENPNEGWRTSFSDEEHARDLFRLGNYTLLEKALNTKDAANAAYSRKLEIYARSQYELTRRIAALEWNPDTLRSRQQQMAAWATAVWRFA
jgi:hypothetical protein